MRKLLLLAIVLVFTYEPAGANTYGGDDGAPWPFTWGKECPFPWDNIEGSWKVEGSKTGSNTGNKLVFTADESVGDGGKLLYVEHFASTGILLGTGTGYVDTTNKITKAVMNGQHPNDRYRRYRLLVRSYSALKSGTCGSRQVMAVTFCPIRGKKCMETSNYRLSRKPN